MLRGTFATVQSLNAVKSYALANGQLSLTYANTGSSLVLATGKSLVEEDKIDMPTRAFRPARGYLDLPAIGVLGSDRLLPRLRAHAVSRRVARGPDRLAAMRAEREEFIGVVQPALTQDVVAYLLALEDGVAVQAAQ